jgi:hypothetical protein
MTSCLCEHGLPYLKCYSSALQQAGCTGFQDDGKAIALAYRAHQDMSTDSSNSDWSSVEQDWFQSNCGGIPASVQATMTPPSTVFLSFAYVVLGPLLRRQIRDSRKHTEPSTLSPSTPPSTRPPTPASLSSPAPAPSSCPPASPAPSPSSTRAPPFSGQPSSDVTLLPPSVVPGVSPPHRSR